MKQIIIPCLAVTLLATLSDEREYAVNNMAGDCNR